MSSTQSTTAWKQLAGEILAVKGHDLETLLLPVLRSIWPGLVRPRSLGSYDAAGCDLIAQTDDDQLEVVIQAKGFFASEGLSDSHVSQILASIEKFANSELKTDHYVLVHSRDGRNRDAARTIDAALETLKVRNKAKTVAQWDRIQCLSAIEKRLREMIDERLSEQTVRFLAEFDALFESGSEYVDVIPLQVGELKLNRGQSADIKRDQTAKPTRLAQMLGKAKSHQWTLLTGLFGSGKTSAALHAAREWPNGVIYVPAANVEPRRGEFGTNVLMSRIIEALHLFDDYDVDERAQYQRLGGPVLRAMLSSENSERTLIIDALDENRALATPDEITRFASMLTELRCKIVLTTREEHFRATFGNIDHLFKELSQRGGGVRNMKLLEVLPWTRKEVGALVVKIQRQKPDNPGLKHLYDVIASDQPTGWPEELLTHPFFLRMILDLVASGANPADTRVAILNQWSFAKLARDLRSARNTICPVTDRDAYIDDMEALMERAAGEMIELQNSEIRLLETLDSDRLLELASDIFRIRCRDLSAAIAVTFFNPVTQKFRGSVPLRFTHRAFQEYYLARHIVKQQLEIDPYPAIVQMLASELRDEPAKI